MSAFGDGADRFQSLPTLGFTHYQAAQPITVGRRFANWGYDLYLAATRLIHAPDLPAGSSPVLRGFRGATGTQASFLALLDNNEDLVDRFETQTIARLLGDEVDFEPEHAADRRDAIAAQMRANAGFDRMADDYASQTVENFMWHESREYCFRLTPLITGQTYPRVLDVQVLADLASVAAVLHKIATDIRLLSNRKEIDEPFGEKQIGSSAMPYKRNPMKCERICGLARFVMNLVGNAYDTAATQWLERTLDDSSNRRLSLPEAFLALDGCLDLMHEVASGLVVHEAMVRKNLMAELPFLATENILMEAVKAGGDRQEYHEIIRAHAQAAGMRVKHEGLDNDLLDRLQNDKAFWSTARGGPLTRELDWSNLMDPMKYVGRAVEQTERFIAEVVEPLRGQYGDGLDALGSSDRGV
ncbi:MAG: adenylosuccinate lyase [Phycisphaeraceae bacterium]|nr:adenylosuccinate lyase [Phycisphaeraceae bacterium]